MLSLLAPREALYSSSTFRAQTNRSGPVLVSAATNGPGVAATNGAILRHRAQQQFRDGRSLRVLHANDYDTGPAVPDRVEFMRSVADVPVLGDRHPAALGDGPDPLFVRRIDRKVVIVHLDIHPFCTKTVRDDVLAQVPIEKEGRKFRRLLQARTGSLPRFPCPAVRSHRLDR